MSKYTELTPAKIQKGIEKAIEKAEAVLDGVVAEEDQRSFENTLRALDRIADILARSGLDYHFMGYVHPDKEVRSAAKDAEERVTKWASDIFFRDDLNAAVKEYAGTEQAASLRGEHRRLLDFVLRDLRRAGHELDPETRERVKQLTQRLIELEVRFQQNIDEWEDWILATADDLEGMPQAWIDGLEVDEESGKYKVTIAYPHLVPFLENSPRRDLREQLRFKFNTVAVEENRKILEEALLIRQQIAEMFGQPTWAHHRLELRMAKAPERVTQFYDELRDGLTSRAKEEVAAVSRLLQADTGDSVVEAWDFSYYDTQQRKTDYGVDNFEVAKYLPLESVLDGMFELTSEMFGISFEEIVSFDSWHEDVKLYAIHDTDTREELGRFFLDLFPREGKYGHAAEFPLLPSRLHEEGSYQNPVCAMVANLTKPTKDSPSLLQHSEVETLFHEFGHVLHQNLGRTEVARFSGTNTERDFVEAPSQIMENWIWDADVLRRFARHYETGEVIPDELVDQLVAARNLNKGRFYLGQMAYGWWDQELHAGPDRDLDEILIEGTRMSLLPHQEGTFSLASFGHLLGGYDAGYYGYLWAQVFGDDIFSRFEKEGVTNPEVGKAYRREVLGRGGALDADEMLVNFLGREPRNEAFLRKLGIEGTN
ncbi:MAG TPA: M3 family metallopeptidase [Acidimicrobiia bacterium]|nr:M3 family metallopeptidase [Acidimicrobiia bacterium]